MVLPQTLLYVLLYILLLKHVHTLLWLYKICYRGNKINLETFNHNIVHFIITAIRYQYCGRILFNVCIINFLLFYEIILHHFY